LIYCVRVFTVMNHFSTIRTIIGHQGAANTTLSLLLNHPVCLLLDLIDLHSLVVILADGGSDFLTRSTVGSPGATLVSFVFDILYLL